MPYFKLTAEHIGHAKGNAIIKQAEDVMDLHVLHAGHDDVFTNMFHIVVEATQAEVNKLRDFIWGKNNGAFCEVTKNWTEEMEWEELDREAGWL